MTGFADWVDKRLGIPGLFYFAAIIHSSHYSHTEK